MLIFWLWKVKVKCGEYHTPTWEFKGEFNNTEEVNIGIVDGEVNKDNPKNIAIEYQSSIF